MHCWLKLKKHKWKLIDSRLTTDLNGNKQLVEIYRCDYCRDLNVKFVEGV